VNADPTDIPTQQVLVGTYTISRQEIIDAVSDDGTRCAFCRGSGPLRKDGTCSDFCSEGEHGWFRRLEGKPLPTDNERGREWIGL
jgi:hypothetical protein